MANGVREGHANTRRLDSWKEIAQYFGRDERTVRRWEEHRGLPVCRVPGGGKTTVFAYVGELEAWLKKDATLDEDEPNSRPEIAFATSDGARFAPRRTPWVVVALVATLLWVISADSGNNESYSRAKPGDSAAYGLFLKGQFSWQTRTPAGLWQAIRDFRQAVRVDSRFAPAYAGLADCYDLMPEYAGMSPAIAFPEASAEARMALSLDPNLADAHAALAFAEFWWFREVKSAMGEFRRSLELDPRSAQAHHWYASALAMLGESRESLNEIDRAEELAPGKAVLADKGALLADAGRFGDAVQLLREVETAEPGFAPVHAYLAGVYNVRGDAGAMLREMRLHAEITHDEPGLAIVAAGEGGYASGGRLEMVRRMFAAEQAFYARGQFSPFELAQQYSARGDHDRAFALLDESIERHESLAMGLRVDHSFDDLHADRRFAGLLKKEGLPPFPGS